MNDAYFDSLAKKYNVKSYLLNKIGISKLKSGIHLNFSQNNRITEW